MSRRRHNAFTTIELLVAISILVILAGMVFVGFKVVGTGGKTRSTKAALESAKSMLAEIDATGGMSQIKGIYSSQPTPNNYFPPLSAGTPTPLAPYTGTVQRGQGNVSTDAYSSAHTFRYTAPAVVLTQQVMGRLLSSPVNRATLSQIPAERLLHKPDGNPPAGSITFNPSTGNGQPNPPVLVDAWDNPIIYVPPAGLRNVYFADNPNQERVVTSVGVRSTAGYTAFPPGASGFWASAGPDGDFTTGDDNLYSFE